MLFSAITVTNQATKSLSVDYFNQRKQEFIRANRKYQNRGRHQGENQTHGGYQGHNRKQPLTSHENKRVVFMTGESTANIN